MAAPLGLWAGNPAFQQLPANNTQQPTLAISAFCSPLLNGRHLSYECTDTGSAPISAQPDVYSPCGRAIQLTYKDEYFDLGCNQEGFTGYFAPSRWEGQKINGDGGVDVTGAPDGLLVEGANSALVSVDAGSTVQWRIAIPAEGYAVFGWRVVGGSNLFSVLVNEKQVVSGNAEDRFFSPLLRPGDQLTLQLNASTPDAAVELSQFRLLTNAMGVTCRHWTAADETGEEASFCQFITFQRPSIAQVLFPANRDGIDAPAAAGSAETHPDLMGYPVFDRDGNPDTPNDQFAVNEICGYHATWTDETTFDGTRCVLKRHWLVIDNCASNTMRMTQVIYLHNNAGNCLPPQPDTYPAPQLKAPAKAAPAVITAAL